MRRPTLSYEDIEGTFYHDQRRVADKRKKYMFVFANDVTVRAREYRICRLTCGGTIILKIRAEYKRKYMFLYESVFSGCMGLFVGLGLLDQLSCVRTIYKLRPN